jgi:hypothetical protein
MEIVPDALTCGESRPKNDHIDYFQLLPVYVANLKNGEKATYKGTCFEEINFEVTYMNDDGSKASDSTFDFVRLTIDP